MRRLGILLFLAAASSAPAARTPSSDLSFHIGLAPDSITVGDPILLTCEAGGPTGANLQLPVLADSVGKFSVLSADAPVAEVKDGRLHLRQSARMTLFKSGTDTLPSLPLLWVRAPGETLVAYSQPLIVRVRSVLKGQADLKGLHGLKGVIPLSRPQWWLWGSLALLAAVLVYLAIRYRHLLRRRVREVLEPVAPPVPPEIAFEAGLDALLARQLPENGLVKEFYTELSLLLRRYLEDRFRFPAVEETRTEVMAGIARVPGITEDERRELFAWLSEGDLVKFAKMERLLADAANAATRARAWVRATAAPRFVAEAAAVATPGVPAGVPGAAPASVAAGPADAAAGAGASVPPPSPSESGPPAEPLAANRGEEGTR